MIEIKLTNVDITYTDTSLLGHCCLYVFVKLVFFFRWIHFWMITGERITLTFVPVLRHIFKSKPIILRPCGGLGRIS